MSGKSPPRHIHGTLAPIKKKMTNFYLTKIIVVESLESNKSSKGVYEDIIKRRSEQYNLDSEYIRVKNKSEFKYQLNQINTKEVLPYIHIETHGSTNGIKFIEDRITWNELKELLRPINIASKNNLLVSVAACYSSNIVEILVKEIMLGLNPITPVFGIIGANIETPESELEIGFTEFFDEIIMSRDISKGMKRLIKSTSKDYKFEFGTCVGVFNKAVNSILQKYIQNRFASPEKAIEFLEIINKYNQIHFGLPIDLSTPEKINEIFNSEQFYLDYFNNIRNSFLMIDKYPENQKRFGTITNINGWQSNPSFRVRKRK